MEITVTMKVLTHGCGLVYCVPNYVYQHTCPVCAGKKIAESEMAVKQYARSNAALRGALTRRRK